MYKRYKNKIIDLSKVCGIESGESNVPGEPKYLIKFELSARSKYMYWAFTSALERDDVFSKLMSSLHPEDL
jgi:hypothetical protein